MPTLADDHLIFIVDDDEHLRRLVASWLRGRGYQVAEFATGEAAVEGLHSMLPVAVLLDLNLGDGIDGSEVLDRIKRSHRFLPVILVTADRDVDTVVRSMKDGAYDFLAKPLTEAKLLKTVDNAVERHRMALRLSQLERDAGTSGFHGIIGASQSIRRVFSETVRVAAADVSVLVHGESGTGKELVARAIHEQSARGQKEFVAVNCAALVETLIESELFGHEKGSFTGAQQRHVGKFEQVDGGTLFLDEVAELSPSAQAKLLRVLQERRIVRIGGTSSVPVDFRLVCATHKDLRKEVDAGRFREDLYFRIVVFELELPPLRERVEDIPLLTQFFLSKAATSMHIPAPAVDHSVYECLLRHRWPGNVRELENAVQRMVVSAGDGTVNVQDLPRSMRADFAPEPSLMPSNVVRFVAPRQEPGADLQGKTLADLEREAIEAAMKRFSGNRALVAGSLGIGRTTLYRKLKEYGLEVDSMKRQ